MMFRTTALALGALLTLGACADPALTDKVNQLEAKVAELEKKVEAAANAPRRGPRGGPEVDPAKEAGAREAISKISGKVADLAWDDANKLCADARKDFGATQTFRRGGRICDEAEVVGRDAMDMDVSKWFQGEAKHGRRQGHHARLLGAAGARTASARCRRSRRPTPSTRAA